MKRRDAKKSDLDHLLKMATSNRRVCPLRIPWEKLWTMLPEKGRVGGTWQPCPPPILGDWWTTTNKEKKDRFLSHLRHAHAKGATEAVGRFLSALREEEWLHEKREG